MKRMMRIIGDVEVEGYGKLAFQVTTDLHTDASLVTGTVGTTPFTLLLPAPKKRTKPIAPGQSLCTALEQIASNFLTIAFEGLDEEAAPIEADEELDEDGDDPAMKEYRRLVMDGAGLDLDDDADLIDEDPEEEEEDVDYGEANHNPDFDE